MALGPHSAGALGGLAVGIAVVGKQLLKLAVGDGLGDLGKWVG